MEITALLTTTTTLHILDMEINGARVYGHQVKERKKLIIQGGLGLLFVLESTLHEETRI